MPDKERKFREKMFAQFGELNKRGRKVPLPDSREQASGADSGAGPAPGL